MTAAKILAIAEAELGVTERPANSNKVKYNDAYGKGNIAWCCVFVWWVFQQAGADKLFYGGGKTAYCPYLLSFHKGKGQSVHGNYQPGDIIFFNFSGGKGASHVGICESWDGTNITTIDGNTGTTNEANGGAVMRRKRNKKYIVGAYRPAYGEEDTVDQKQFDEMMENWMARKAKLPGSSWGKMKEAKAAGITDGTRPQSFATREEVATMMVNAKKK